MISMDLNGKMIGVGASIVQLALAFSTGFTSDHPFGCTNAMIGCGLSGMGIYLFWVNGKPPSDTCLYWQGFAALGYLAHCLGMLFVLIYSKGSCETLVEGCDDATATWAAIVCLGLCSAISAVLFFMIRKNASRYKKARRFRTSYAILMVLGVFAWFSGICAIDGTSSQTSMGVMCFLGGASTVAVILPQVRRRMAFQFALAGEAIIAIIILSVGLTKKDADGVSYMRDDALTTQLLSLTNLLVGAILMALSYWLGWDVEKGTRGGVVKDDTPKQYLSYSSESHVMEEAAYYQQGKQPILTMSDTA